MTPGTRSGSPQLHSSSEYGSQEEKTCPNHYPRDRWEVDTKNYFILLWGPFYTHSSFLHVFGSLCCDSSLSPNRSVHFPHLSEGSDRSKYMMYWEMTGSFHGLHVLRVTGPEDPWFLQVPDYNTCPSVSQQPEDYPSPLDWSSMKTEEHLLFSQWSPRCIAQSLSYQVFSVNIQWI